MAIDNRSTVQNSVMSSLNEEIETGEDWTEKFIQTIQSKPGIYNKRMKEHSDKLKISQLWSEVSQTMIPNWDGLDSQMKVNKEKELQQRWRNLRTCFMRELAKQKSGKSGQAAIKRRKYLYFDTLLFLLPTIEDRETVSDTSPPHIDQERAENEDEQIHEATYTQKQHTGTRKSTKRNTSYEESLLNILKDKRNEEIDEDKSFLLSLVPSFKKLSEEQKFPIKIEFLSILNYASRAKHSDTPDLSICTDNYYLNENALPHMMYTRPNISHTVSASPFSSAPAHPGTSRSNTVHVHSNPTSPESEFFELS